MLATGAYRCDCGPDCDGWDPRCCRDCCPGARRMAAWASHDPLGYLTAAAARYARANPAATVDTFVIAMACRFTPAEHGAIIQGFRNVRDGANNG